jgi:hypothetical protein
MLGWVTCMSGRFEFDRCGPKGTACMQRQHDWPAVLCVCVWTKVFACGPPEGGRVHSLCVQPYMYTLAYMNITPELHYYASSLGCKVSEPSTLQICKTLRTLLVDLSLLSHRNGCRPRARPPNKVNKSGTSQTEPGPGTRILPILLAPAERLGLAVAATSCHCCRCASSMGI